MNSAARSIKASLSLLSLCARGGLSDDPLADKRAGTNLASNCMALVRSDGYGQVRRGSVRWAYIGVTPSIIRSTAMSGSIKQLPRLAHVILQCLTVVLLLSSICLALLIVLTPTYGQSLSMFTLEPMGQERAGVAMMTPSNATNASSVPPRLQVSDTATSQPSNDHPTMSDRPTKGDAADGSDGSVDRSTGRSMYRWLGVHGPSIYVGAMREFLIERRSRSRGDGQKSALEPITKRI